MADLARQQASYAKNHRLLVEALREKGFANGEAILQASHANLVAGQPATKERRETLAAARAIYAREAGISVDAASDIIGSSSRIGDLKDFVFRGTVAADQRSPRRGRKSSFELPTLADGSYDLLAIKGMNFSDAELRSMTVDQLRAIVSSMGFTVSRLKKDALIDAAVRRSGQISNRNAAFRGKSREELIALVPAANRDLARGMRNKGDIIRLIEGKITGAQVLAGTAAGAAAARSRSRSRSPALDDARAALARAQADVEAVSAAEAFGAGARPASRGRSPVRARTAQY